jgi:hypothetical protein
LAPKERGQNPNLGDTVRLRLFIFNGNNLSDPVSVDGINIFVCDPDEVTMENPNGRRFVFQVDPTTIVRECVGSYYADVYLESPLFTLGKYADEWSYKIDPNIKCLTSINEFKVYPQLWYTTPVPVVYDFSFDFQPNKIRKGSIQYLRVRVTPNVPRATDLARYYENLAILGDITVSLEQKCGPCVPEEYDERLILDEEPVSFKEKCFGYYQLDTTELDCSIYAIWFTLCLGGNKYVSDKFNLQIFS